MFGNAVWTKEQVHRASDLAEQTLAKTIKALETITCKMKGYAKIQTETENDIRNRRVGLVASHSEFWRE